MIFRLYIWRFLNSIYVQMIVDLRSDTVTKPTPAMLERMFAAPVGDDVFQEDETVQELEERTATLFGHQAGLFCPSGTMTNQLAIKVHTFPGSEVICDKKSHIYLYEGGGVASNSLSSMKLLEGNYGRITAAQVKEAINNPQDIHQPITSLVSLENTMNKGGGAYYTLESIREIREVCTAHQLPLHLDGARLFNALVETKDSPEEVGKEFDSISICFSKGLGCPVGSVLVGSKEFILKARRHRKAMGGGMRQAGFLAAAGLYALENHIDRLKEDHIRAQKIGEALKKAAFVKQILPIETNIVIFELNDDIVPTLFLELLYKKGIKAVSFGGQYIRFVTHLDFNDDQLAYVCTHLTTLI